MKKVYIQIIDPINGTCVNACHEYPDEYNQAVLLDNITYQMKVGTLKL